MLRAHLPQVRLLPHMERAMRRVSGKAVIGKLAPVIQHAVEQRGSMGNPRCRSGTSEAVRLPCRAIGAQ